MEKKLLFQAKDICKEYPGTKALKGVSLDVYEGEILGLVGENGAGKSTLFKIINGVEEATAGEMIMNGAPYKPKNPREANESGIGMVFQEQSIILNLTIGQNIFFGQEKEFSHGGLINWKQMYKKASEILAAINNADIQPEKKASEYNFAKRQMVEIAKVLHVAKSGTDGKCIILLDEPTSVLGDVEIQQLYTEMRKLKEQGHCVIFVSHRLDEILTITDRIYVFKDGENVGEINTADADENKIYEMMVGREGTGTYYHLDEQRTPSDKVVLKVDSLSKKGVFKNVSFELHEGEVLGFIGVVGSGKEDVCAAICGDDPADGGTIEVSGKKVELNEPVDALKNGILCIPKERRVEGIMGTLPVYENMTISNLNVAKSGGLVTKSKQISIAKELVKKLRIKLSDVSEEIENLSGGNAQKAVFARALISDANIIILNHPTRGVDVGAKLEIYSLIREAAANNKSVILLGDTLAECAGMSNRILAMKDGLITGEFDASADNKPSEVELVKKMM
jgi:ribose transport system ATP-binding protein